MAFENYYNIGMQIIYVLTFLFLSSALKMSPPPLLNGQNFSNYTGVSLQTFLQSGSSSHNPWVLLFKIPDCKHCTHAEMFFQSLFIEYNKRLHFEKDTVKDLLETNLSFAVIDCQESKEICSRFSVQQYPTIYVIQGNGEACNYIGDRMPGSMMLFLEERKRGEGKSQCKPLGKITFMTKIMGYLEPLIQLLNYNTALFFLAFVIGPFLFGFVFSRNKAQKMERAAALQQQQKIE